MADITYASVYIKCSLRLKHSKSDQSDDIVTGILPNAFTAYTQNQEFIGKHAHDACTPFSATLYSPTGVCGGIPSFVVFAPGRGLWVLVGAASTRWF